MDQKHILLGLYNTYAAGLCRHYKTVEINVAAAIGRRERAGDLDILHIYLTICLTYMGVRSND